MTIYEVGSIFHTTNTIGNNYLMKIKEINYTVGVNNEILRVTYTVKWSGVPTFDKKPRWGKVYPSYEDGKFMSHSELSKRMRSEVDRNISPLDVAYVKTNPFNGELFEI